MAELQHADEFEQLHHPTSESCLEYIQLVCTAKRLSTHSLAFIALD